MLDLPQHAALINTFKQICLGNQQFTEIFEINWFVPYWTGYLLVYFLTFLFPIKIAIKIVVSLSVITIPLLSGVLFRKVGADERFKWLVIPSTMGFTFYLGFLNYLVALPFGMLLLIFTVRFDRNPSLKNGVLIALYSVFLFFCHVIVLGYVSLLALAYLAGANYNYKKFKTLIFRYLPYTTPLPLIAMWLLKTTTPVDYTHISPLQVIFHYDLRRFSVLIEGVTGFDSFFYPFILIVCALIIVFPFITKARFNKSPARWFPLVVGIFLFFFFPFFAFGTACLYPRFGGFLTILWFLVWDPSENKTNSWHWTVIAMVFVWVLLNVFRFNLFDKDAKGFDQIMAAMEPEKKVLSMIVEPESPYFKFHGHANLYMNFSSWYGALHNGFVDNSFAAFGGMAIRYKVDRRQKLVNIHHGRGWPLQFRWQDHYGALYDYFIVRAKKDMSEELFKEKRNAVALKAQSGMWWLYENKERK